MVEYFSANTLSVKYVFFIAISVIHYTGIMEAFLFVFILKLSRTVQGHFIHIVALELYWFVPFHKITSAIYFTSGLDNLADILSL